MDPALESTLLTKLAPVTLGIVAVLVASRFRRIPWREGLGLQWPAARVVAGWLLVWIAWVALVEVAIVKLGLDQAQPWKAYAPVVFWLRVLAIGVVGPVAEELLMRGLAFDRLRRTPLRAGGAVVVCALLWALAHVSYGWGTIAVIFADGLLLGAARARSGSVLLPMLMHAGANLFSIWQSTHG